MSSTGESPPPRPLRADAERNRQRILTAGREVFASRGLDVSLDEIAAHAGVGIGTLYRRYPNKNALIAELFTERLAFMVTLTRQAAEEPHPWTALIRLLETLADMYVEDRGLKDVMLARVASGFGRDQLATVKADVDALIGRAIASGDVRPDLTGDDIYGILLMISHVAEPHDPSPGPWRRYLGLLIDGLGTTRDRPTTL